MKDLKISIKDGILIIEDVSLKEALNIKNDFELSTKNTYPYLLYKSHLGYYAGWDCTLDKSIYCGTRSETESIKQIKEYIND